MLKNSQFKQHIINFPSFLEKNEPDFDFICQESKKLSKQFGYGYPSSISELMSLVYPQLNRASLLRANNLNMFEFMLDNVVDSPETALEIRVEITKQCVEAIDYPDKVFPPSESGIEKWAICLQKLMKIYQEVIQGNLFTQIFKQVRDYLEKGVLPRIMKDTDEMTLAEYQQIRYFDIAAEPCLSETLLDTGLNFNYDDEEIVEARRCAVVNIFLTNDLYSYAKELKENTVMNYVHLLRAEKKLSHKDAVMETIELMNEEYKKLVAIRDAATDKDKRQYLEFIVHWVEADYYWHAKCPRYNDI